MVAFTSGAENAHGVEAVTRGIRCQLGAWFTEDAQRAAHADELDLAERALSRTEEQLSEHDPHDWRAADRRYEDMCRRAAEGHVIRQGRRVADLQLPGRDLAVPVEVLSDLPGPQITRVRGIVTEDEIAHILAKASPHFKDAVVFEGEQLTQASYRTSSTSWLSNDDEDPVIHSVLARIEAVTGLSLESAEELQIARYVDVNQGKYEAHLDWGIWGAKRNAQEHGAAADGLSAGAEKPAADVQKFLLHVRLFGCPGVGTTVRRDFGYGAGGAEVGARAATFLLYLNEVDAGGATVFVSHNVSVAAEKGTAIFWYNLHPSGSGDELTRHGACPVQRGEKYIMTKWIHELGNEAVFGAAEGLPRVARDWSGVAQLLREGAREERPQVRSLPCGERAAAHRCALEPLQMARSCPGHCDEASESSAARGRAVVDGVLSPELSARLARLAPAAAAVASGPPRGGRTASLKPGALCGHHAVRRRQVGDRPDTRPPRRSRRVGRDVSAGR
ncbi:unnamed protein product [Prorocentrum cordatum]|uniref:Fe2OG dioxygenase domain-containing protein n=1 Tax=Prorocentrum cordatum TaxID=2364126 RepID=A0ABN9RM15_9DINO|nr:unnamed protein product [Polarella glacialis]